MAKHGARAVREFTSAAYGQFGMRIVILAACLDIDGEPAVSLCVRGSFFMHFSQFPIASTTTTRTEEPHSRTACLTGVRMPIMP
jgi:hypothetical protein